MRCRLQASSSDKVLRKSAGITSGAVSSTDEAQTHVYFGGPSSWRRRSLAQTAAMLPAGILRRMAMGLQLGVGWGRRAHAYQPAYVLILGQAGRSLRGPMLFRFLQWLHCPDHCRTLRAVSLAELNRLRAGALDQCESASLSPEIQGRYCGCE